MLANAATPAPEGSTVRRIPGSRGPLLLRGPAAAAGPYAIAVLFVIVLGTALWKSGISQPNVFSTLPFILAVQIAAFAWGRGPAIAAAVAGAVTFNYYWIGQPYSFQWLTPQEWFLFGASIAIALGLGTVTDRMRAARRQAAELAVSERLQRSLLDSISHDLRTPLTTIRGSLSTLLAEEGAVGQLGASARRELLSVAYDRAKVLDWFVGQILDMTRLDAGVVRIQVEPASIADLIRHVLRSLGPIGARCRLTIPDDFPPVPIDIVLLAQALRNVIDNAARYSAPDGAIEIEAGGRPSEIVVSVADRGPGIPEADLARVFEKFYQVRGDGDGRGGAGLGLAIAKGIVEAHRGRIWAERREGGGTIVRIALPAA